MAREFSSDATLALRRAHADPAAIEYERQQQHKAARVVAGTYARDADDCAVLLDMLGLTAKEGKQRA